ncbi:MAG TPA: hypothetical protein VK599_09125 [Streptosporangiaceae bacterium]|nr:hypothetical protein [Streptosporangiaceae bacterium]
MPPALTTTALVPALDPLSAAERESLQALIARDAASKGPAGRIGDPYVALTWLSVPRRGDKDRATDRVPPGETVYLTEEEARRFERHDPGSDGRMTSPIRKLSGPDGSREPLPPRVVPNGSFLLPRYFSGRLFRPVMPPAGDIAPRPDPPESSAIQVIDDGRAPESAGAMSPEPSEMASHLTGPAAPDAVDLPPRRAARGR